MRLPLSAALTAVVETPRRVAAKTDRQTNEAILFSWRRARRQRQSEWMKQMTNETVDERRATRKCLLLVCYRSVRSATASASECFKNNWQRSK